MEVDPGSAHTLKYDQDVCSTCSLFTVRVRHGAGIDALVEASRAIRGNLLGDV